MSCPSSFSSVFFVGFVEGRCARKFISAVFHGCFTTSEKGSVLMTRHEFRASLLLPSNFPPLFLDHYLAALIGRCFAELKKDSLHAMIHVVLSSISLKNKGSIRNPRYGDSAISKFSLDPTFSAPYFYMVSAAADGGDVNCSIDENTDRTAVNSGPQSVVREKKAKRRLSEHAGTYVWVVR
ncbi:hypothetical protein MUK42_10502 [Musa troglodytarum]|uniref:Uncharacterized protein n=1 Tax=Musa troglodytarum TaxID=320322 RepID=A0A9E7GU95_9LILI|nr:hypothetical protein MUK42_10502 [Musa troglodytarum]